MELRHYNKKQYSDLTPGQKAKPIRLREEEKAEVQRKVSYLEYEVQQLKAKIAATYNEPAGSENANRSLTRQPGKR